jgi:hypothetical protein
MSRIIKKDMSTTVTTPSKCLLIKVDFKIRKVIARIRLGEL